MKRDGATTSLWQHDMPDFVSKTTGMTDTIFDVVIVGGGITGITTGLLLQKAGKKCVVAEAYTLCFGTTGGTTAHLNTFVDTTYAQVKKDFGEDAAQLLAKATQQALDLVKNNVQEYSIDCGYEEKDGYVFSQNPDQTKELQDMLQSSLKAGVEVAQADHIPVPVPFEKAIMYPHQAQFHPAKYVYALAKAFEEAGGVILENCAVTDVADGEILNVQTSIGIISGRQLIYATHIPPGINLLHFRCAPYRSYAMAVKLKDNQYPDGLAYDMYDPYHYYRTQNVEGEKYLIAGGEDHKTAHAANTEACFTKLESYLQHFFAIDHIAFKWSSQYFEPADGLAYIGNLPGNPNNVYVATGYGGNGMTYSHIAAITLSEILLTGDSLYADLFDPGRIKPVAGFTNFVKENADVVAKFFGKRFSESKLPELAGLATGEAKVVKFEGDSVAIYKDDSGRLHAINPVCTHAKCIVAWNTAEKTWDCPCHGARYSADGQVLTGPARLPLELISLEDLIEKGEQ